MKKHFKSINLIFLSCKKHFKKLMAPYYISKTVSKKNIFFLCFKSIFCMFSDRFEVVMSKIIFFKKKFYFDIFSSKKYFKKQLLS